MSYDQGGRGLPPAAARPGAWPQLCTAARTATARLLYRYYCWRADTFSDLQLLLGLSAALFLMGAWVQSGLMRGLGSTADAPLPAAGVEAPGWWLPLYAVGGPALA